MLKSFFIFAICLLLVPAPAYAMRPFITKGSDAAAALIPPVPDSVQDIVLVASTPATVTWPAGAVYAIFSATGNFWIGASGQTATVPVSSITNGTGSLLNPGQLQSFSDTSFSLITSVSGGVTVTIAFYGNGVGN